MKDSTIRISKIHFDPQNGYQNAQFIEFSSGINETRIVYTSQFCFHMAVGKNILKS